MSCSCSSAIVKTTKGVYNALHDHESMSTCSNILGGLTFHCKQRLSDACGKSRFPEQPRLRDSEVLQTLLFKVTFSTQEISNCERPLKFEHTDDKLWKSQTVKDDKLLKNGCHFWLVPSSFIINHAALHGLQEFVSKWLRAEATQLAHDHLNDMMWLPNFDQPTHRRHCVAEKSPLTSQNMPKSSTINHNQPSRHPAHSTSPKSHESPAGRC